MCPFNCSLWGLKQMEPVPSHPTTSVDELHEWEKRWPRLWRVGERLSVGAITTIAKLYTSMFAKVTILHRERFDALVQDCSKQSINTHYPQQTPRGLITVLNHHSTLDDVIVWTSILKPRQLLHLETDPEKARQRLWPYGWRRVWAAAELLFANKWTSLIFGLGGAIPIDRTSGLYQPAVGEAIKLLNAGRWVSLHPEGKISKQPHPLLKLRPGIGKLIVESNPTPLVLPIYHLGMSEVIDYDGALPKPGARVLIVCGKPIDYGPIISELQQKNPRGKRSQIYATLTNMIESELRSLEVEAVQAYKNIYQGYPATGNPLALTPENDTLMPEDTMPAKS